MRYVGAASCPHLNDPKMTAFIPTVGLLIIIIIASVAKWSIIKTKEISTILWVIYRAVIGRRWATFLVDESCGRLRMPAEPLSAAFMAGGNRLTLRPGTKHK